MPEMWGRDDYLSRWIHGLVAIPLFGMIALDLYWMWNHHHYFSGVRSVGNLTVCGYGLYFVCFRLLKYAFTGEGSINDKDS